MNSKLAIIALSISSALFSVNSYAEDLMDIYKEAYLRDPVVLQAKANKDTAYAAIGEATAALLPQIDITGSVTKSFGRNHGGDGASSGVVESEDTIASGGVSLSQSLWRHSSWTSRNIATKNAAMYDVAYADALQNLIIRVSDAYFAVLRANDALIFAKANSEALARQLAEATRRFQVGLIAETDQLEAQAAYDLSRAQVISAENALINSYEGLRKLTGRNIRSLQKLDENKFSTVPVTKSLKQLTDIAENNNLSLQQSIIARDIASDNITLAKTGYEPTLDLVGKVTTSWNDADKPTSREYNSNGSSIGVNFNMPLFSGGATASQVEQAEHQYVAAAESTELTHRSIIANINNDYNNVNAAISSVRAYEQSVKSATSALNATQAGYEVGTRTMTDVLNATQNLYSAKENLSGARFDFIMSRLNLLYTQGLLQVQDIEEVNKGLERK